jgi:hypothetical protein
MFGVWEEDSLIRGESRDLLKIWQSFERFCSKCVTHEPCLSPFSTFL